MKVSFIHTLLFKKILKEANLSAFLALFLTIFTIGFFLNYEHLYAQTEITPFGKISLEESAIPIHSGVPGKTPFWNSNARQFIYAPAFDYKVINSADKYRYAIVSEVDGSKYNFDVL